MSPKDFSEIAGSVAWPITTLLVLAVFHSPIVSLLDKLSATLGVKTVKLKALGVEVELTPEQARKALDELLQEIASPMNELSQEETTLFERVMAAGGRDTVGDLIPGFKRESREHQRLRKLRDRMLIRPAETGSWTPERHPIATRFGQLAYNLRGARESA